MLNVLDLTLDQASTVNPYGVAVGSGTCKIFFKIAQIAEEDATEIAIMINDTAVLNFLFLKKNKNAKSNKNFGLYMYVRNFKFIKTLNALTDIPSTENYLIFKKSIDFYFKNDKHLVHKNMQHILHQNFQSKIFIRKFILSSVLMELTTDVPWVILVPQLNQKLNILDLSNEEQSLLQEEINKVGSLMKKFFNFDQINIATIGNVTPQLHVHIIARFKDDKFWPDVIWGKDFTRNTEDEVRNKYIGFIDELKKLR